ncbi:YbaB/EbfC family nucleoid-associated protein [Glycomyces xiaoerkulensis]|uniref:YbaB/EbfC family nucleoid-associated protein n=1 Tax=Glycomyces xiaoerkulensis TaxID=2038139 RepID=UPI000C26037B|nr:YbaB/EbfC family nucleoid-associated protein [Glycomyces xiaoerkulensis]
MDNPILGMEDARQRLEAWKDRADRMAADTQAAGSRLQELAVTAGDDNGLVEITVDSGGTMTDIRLSSRVQRQAAEHTQATILDTYRKAQVQLAEEAAAIVADTVGSDSATGKALMSGFTRRLDDGDEPGAR